MKLIQCTVKGFGKLHEATFDFHDGLNVFLRDNGWGKTTLAAFLKAMLYGLSETRKKDLSENERVRYLPWDTSLAGGALIYESGGRTYRVERTFAKKSTGSDDTCVVYDVATGEVCPIEGNLGEMLFGIDADGFERTVFLSERALSGKNENKSIAAKLSDLVGTDGDIGDLDGAIKALDERRREFYKRTGGGAINRAEEELRELTLSIRACEEQLHEKADTRAQEEAARKREQALRHSHEQMSGAWRALPGPEASSMLSSQLEATEAACTSLRAQCSTLRARFGTAVPTQESITAAEAAAQRLQASAERLHERRKQQAAAQAFFTRPTDEAELVHMRRVLYSKPLGLWLPLLLLLITAALTVCAVLLHIALAAAAVLSLGALIATLVHRRRQTHAYAAVKDTIKAYPTASKDVFLAFEEICRNFANNSSQKLIENNTNANASLDADRETLRSFCEAYGITDTPIPFSALRTALMELHMAEQRLHDEEERGRALAAQRAAFDKAYDAAARGELEAAMQDNRRQLDELLKEQQRIAQDKQRIEELSVELSYLNNRLEQVKENKAAYEKKHAVICRTMDYLKEAARRLTAKYKAKTEEGFGRYMRTLGVLDEPSYQLSTAFELHMDEAGTYRPMDAYSRGTRDLHYFALRLGLIDALYDREQPFLLLDDPFAALDDTHLSHAMHLLHTLSRDRQVLYFTCTDKRTPHSAD